MTDELAERVAKELGWTLQQVRSMSASAVRELLPQGGKLRYLVTESIQSGENLTRPDERKPRRRF